MADTSLRDLIGDREFASPHWTALEEGRLLFPRCSTCGNAWLPPRPECPSCLESNWGWEESSGGGELISWVVYHVAYHEAFTGRLPYNVAIVSLDEGPRVITNLTNLGEKAPHAGAGVELDVQNDGGIALARFRLI